MGNLRIRSPRRIADTGGEERHALVVVVDHNERGMVIDAWVSSQVDKLLGYCRKEAEENALMRFEPIPAAQAHSPMPWKRSPSCTSWQ